MRRRHLKHRARRRLDTCGRHSRWLICLHCAESFGWGRQYQGKRRAS